MPGRIQLFGITAESVPKQVNYISDEHPIDQKRRQQGTRPEQCCLHAPLPSQNHSEGAPFLGLHADNCCGQNKNRTVAAYLSWRTLAGSNKDINLEFMRVGHTRCFVDGGFGLLKQQYRKSDIDTVEQLATAINDSCHFNEAVTFTWQWYQWDTYLSQIFNPVRNITKYQNFHFSAEQPGKVQLSGSSTLEDTTVAVLKPGVD